MTTQNRLHEDLSRAPETREASDRAFGWLFAGLFVAIGVLPLARGSEAKLLPIALGGILGVLTLAAPRSLRPAKRAWLKLAALLHRLTSPVVLAALFYLAVVPTALALKLFGRRPLAREFDRGASSYWIPRRSQPVRGWMTKPF